MTRWDRALWRARGALEIIGWIVGIWFVASLLVNSANDANRGPCPGMSAEACAEVYTGPDE